MIPVAWLDALVRMRMTWPPVMWPSSWAITPCTSLALSAAVIRPEWM